MVFNRGGPFFVYNDTYPEGVQQQGTLIVGQQQRFYTMVPAGHFHHFSVLFTPTGLFRHFGLHIHTLLNNGAPLNACIPAFAEHADTIFGTDTPLHPELFIHRFEHLLSRQYRSGPFTDTRIENAIDTIIRHEGMVPVDILARNASMSIRNFRRVFTRMAGISPKAYIRVIRLQHILHQLKRNDFSMQQWCQIALRYGFFDQTHFIKEFKHFCGMSPCTFVKHITEDAHCFERFFVTPQW
jgi:AraC-like DNA-binding protein